MALCGRRKKTVVVIAALARELCGFVWAIACQISAPERVKMRPKTTTEETKASAPSTTVRSGKSKSSGKTEYHLNGSKKFKK